MAPTAQKAEGWNGRAGLSSHNGLQDRPVGKGIRLRGYWGVKAADLRNASYPQDSVRAGAIATDGSRYISEVHINAGIEPIQALLLQPVRQYLVLRR